MRRVFRYLILLSCIVTSLLLLLPQSASSQLQSSCPALIRHAVERVEEICSSTGRNQMCYANSWTRAEPQAFVRDFSFELGDITDVANVRRLELGELNTRTDDWGMVLMRVQANLPASLPGQTVMYLLFGDINFEIDNRPDVASPMQAFRLETQIGGPDCDQAPPNGLLVQTPHGLGRVLLRVNGVDISLGSTVFFSAQAGGYLNVSTLEGSALVHANGVWSAALPGTQVRVPMDENLEPAGVPGLPEAYDLAAMVTLPVAPLQRPVRVPAPLELPQLLALRQHIRDGVLPEVGSLASLSLSLTGSSLGYLVTPLDDVVTGVNTTVQTTVDTVGAATSEIVTTAGETAADAVNAVTDAAVETVAETADTVDDVVETTTETAAETMDTIEDVVDTTVESVNAVTDDVADETQEALDEVTDAIQQILPLPTLPPLFGR
jgi:hypothetical protein